MHYNHIKVDMDYCADPLWVSRDGIAFANDSLSYYEGVISVELMRGLQLYQNLWEHINWPVSDYEYEKYVSLGYSDSLKDVVSEMQVKLALRLKEELPNVRVYYSVYHEQASHYETVEVTSDHP